MAPATLRRIATLATPGLVADVPDEHANHRQGL
jgi:hypothetical protein